jgi:hypothetical protein
LVLNEPVSTIIKPKTKMYYLLKPLLRALRHMNDRDLKASIIVGIVLFISGLLDLLRLLEV